MVQRWREASHDDLLGWVERVATLLVQEGAPPIAGRTLGWLMVCDPPEQTPAQICAAIGASRASLTTNLRLLITMGFITRHTRPGARTAYYRVDDDAWRRLIQHQLGTVDSYVELARDGLDLVGSDTARSARVRDLLAVFTWMASVFADAPPLPRTPKG